MATTPLSGHAAEVLSLTWNESQGLLYTGSSNGTVLIFDPRTNASVRGAIATGFGGVTSIAVPTAWDAWCAAGSSVVRWDLRQTKDLIMKTPTASYDSKEEINSVDVLKDLVLTAEDSGEVKWRSLAAPANEWTVESHPGSLCMRALFCCEGKFVVSGGMDDALVLHETSKKRRVQRLSTRAAAPGRTLVNPPHVYDLGGAPSTERDDAFVAALGDGSVRVYAVREDKSGAEMKTVWSASEAHGGASLCASFLGSTRTVVSLGSDALAVHALASEENETGPVERFRVGLAVKPNAVCAMSPSTVFVADLSKHVKRVEIR